MMKWMHRIACFVGFHRWSLFGDIVVIGTTKNQMNRCLHCDSWQVLRWHIDYHYSPTGIRYGR